MMRTRPVSTILLTIGTAFMASAQAPDANTRDKPEVFLDNHRPLIKKKEKAPTTRTVSGKVVDDTGQPLEGALVTLTDTKTKERKMFFTKKDGRYDFEDLSFTVDYELQARYKDDQSEPRKLSQYDRTAKVVRILEIGSNETTRPPAATAEAKKNDAAPK